MQEVFARRRARFYEGLKDGVALLFSPPEARYGHDVHYRYRPDPDLYYLTGLNEPEAAAVFDAARKRCVLFLRPRDRAKETWTGLRLGPRGAVRALGVEEARPIGELHDRLPDLIRGHAVLHHAFGEHPEGDAIVSELLARFRREARDPKRGPVVVADPTEVLHELRLSKDPEEVELMARSASIAAAAHREAMAFTKPERFEYELQALIERRFVHDGAAGWAYPTIVASGPNATILHYVENRRRVERGDLVLVDAGCEYEGYASDITRTFPATGKFSRLQRRFYSIVLIAQKRAIAACRTGTPIEQVHETARETLVQGLLELGLLKGRPAEILAKRRDARFVLHRTSHWLGLDVHDRGRYVEKDGGSRRLAPGMVLTVEPGLYVRPDEKNVAPAFLGMGVRIEDDVLVTDAEPRVLTSEAPKEIDELEALVGKAS